MKRIEVAVGIIFDDQGNVLIGQRVVEDLYFKKWEFPGGKLEAGESAQQALIRELKEEIGITVSHSSEFMRLEHDYPDRLVRLHIHLIDQFQGQATSQEGQALRWVAINELNEIDFLQGNQPIIERLQQLDC